MIDVMSPAFRAYTRLTVEARHMKEDRNSTTQITNQKYLAFTDFEKAIEKNEVVNKENARPLSALQHQFAVNQMRYNPLQIKLQQDTLSIIDKAYNLGLVDGNDSLITELDRNE